MSSTPMPSLFVSHGAPTFAIEPGRAGAALGALGRHLPRPRAVVVISPHWMTSGPVRVTLAERPATVHDFGGFPAPLYRLQYPAPGQPQVAQRVLQLLNAAGWPAQPDATRGLDHGAWVPLMHLYPQADVPVVQVSQPASLDGPRAHAFGQALAPLVHEDVLVVGSGSLTHNLYDLQPGATRVAPYVQAFTHWVREAVRAGDIARVNAAFDEAPGAARAHPTPEHLWPLHVALGAAPGPLPVTVIDGGVDYGVIAMESYLFGASLDLEAPLDTAAPSSLGIPA